MNDTEKNIEHGAYFDGIDYSLPFLRDLFASMLTEDTATSDMLRLWQAGKRKEREELEKYGQNLAQYHEQRGERQID